MMPIQIEDNHVKTPLYRIYRFKLWHKFILTIKFTAEHINWLIENVGPYDKKWMYDTTMDTETFKMVMEMVENISGHMFGGGVLAQDLCFPTRLYFKHEEDKLHFILRWM